MTPEDKDRAAERGARSRPPDHRMIEIDKSGEVAFWTKWFGISEAELREAIRVAGSSAHDVHAYLKKTRG